MLGLLAPLPTLFGPEDMNLRAMTTTTNRATSTTGKILGAITLRLSAKALAAALGRLLLRWNPSLPSESSICLQHSYESSLGPWWIRRRHLSLNMARLRRAHLLVKRMAHPPDLNKQLDKIMDRSLPAYQLGLNDSDVTTKANFSFSCLKTL
uniref:Uncharacterized protein n=1 Tax=Opuntia streptacantha TaxID=393608 RepID=A0A7C9AFP3_OPUST